MKKLNVLRFVALIGVVAFFSACQESLIPNEQEVALKSAEMKSANQDKGFVHGIVVEIDGEDYYFAGAPDGPNGEIDVPGHYWVKAGRNKLVGKHYNTGPFGAEKWWSSDAPDGELLYKVDAIIDVWTAKKAEQYAAKGYVHYHEWVRVSDGHLHPSKVVWLKHTARTFFTLDGGPHPGMFPDNEVTPGVDYDFMPNYSDAYPNDSGH